MRRVSGTTGLHLALRAVGVAAGDEVVTTPFSFVATANAVALRGRHGRCSPTSTRSRCDLDPDAAAAAITGRTTRAAAGPHLRLPGRRARRSSATACRSSRTPCEALGARHADGTPVGGRGHPAVFGFYANKQLTTGEGGMVTLGSAEHKERIDSERNQGRAPDMGWLDHDRLGFNYRLSDIACALGLAQLERLDDMLAARARVAGWYREALAGWPRSAGSRCRARTRAATCAAGSCSSCSCPTGVDRDATMLALREHGVQSKPYLPAIHLMSLLPRALRPPAGRVPGLRARRATVARAAVLPGDDARTRSRASPTRSAAVIARLT